jgi:pimeloyl-ACP methyl ester carboxylesterase
MVRTSQLILLMIVLSASGCMTASAQIPEIDTMVDAGGDHLHFHVIRGKGIPILFEAGGGDDGAVWNTILHSVAGITGATLITYDRAGFGQSQIVARDQDAGRHGILNGIEELETGLKTIGHNGDIMLVAHSYGGFYSELYASRHPDLVKAAVLIDANHACWYTDAYTAGMMKDLQSGMAKLETENLGKYYQFANFAKTVAIMRKSAFPSSIPVIDLVSDHPPFEDAADRARWALCHKQFADAAPNREGVVAFGTGHYIFRDDPALVVDAIVKMYSGLLDQPRRDEVLQRGISYAIESANESRRRAADFRSSEESVNSWGYSLLQQHEVPGALEVFHLNITLHPTSGNAYDSYGEALLSAGRTEEALAMYRKSVELNPDNEHGKKVIQTLSNANHR